MVPEKSLSGRMAAGEIGVTCFSSPINRTENDETGKYRGCVKSRAFI
jgi:hypothetical protein